MSRKTTLLAMLLGLMLCPVSMLADDIDIFSGSLISVPPNILIIFDTSGSMAEDVPSTVYDPNHDYTDEVGGSGWGAAPPVNATGYMPREPAAGDR